MPVLPEVASISVSPGLIVPRFSASTTIDSAGRSLTDPAGLLPSSFASSTLELLPGRRCSRTSGVSPTVSSMVRTMDVGLLDRCPIVPPTKTPPRGRGSREGPATSLLLGLLVGRRFALLLARFRRLVLRLFFLRFLFFRRGFLLGFLLRGLLVGFRFLLVGSLRCLVFLRRGLFLGLLRFLFLRRLFVFRLGFLLFLGLHRFVVLPRLGFRRRRCGCGGRRCAGLGGLGRCRRRRRRLRLLGRRTGGGGRRWAAHRYLVLQRAEGALLDAGNLHDVFGALEWSV